MHCTQHNARLFVRVNTSIDNHIRFFCHVFYRALCMRHKHHQRTTYRSLACLHISHARSWSSGNNHSTTLVYTIWLITLSKGHDTQHSFKSKLWILLQTLNIVNTHSPERGKRKVKQTFQTQPTPLQPRRVKHVTKLHITTWSTHASRMLVFSGPSP